jgi:hypothetical protein
MVDPHLMQGLDARQKIPPEAACLILAKLLFVADHVVVEVAAAGEVLGDDVVVGLGFEKVDYFDHLRNVASFLQRRYL